LKRQPKNFLSSLDQSDRLKQRLTQACYPSFSSQEKRLWKVDGQVHITQKKSLKLKRGGQENESNYGCVFVAKTNLYNAAKNM